MENVGDPARALLGEDYPALLERLDGLLDRDASATQLLDDLVPTVAAALEREGRAHRRASQARGIADARARGARLGRTKKALPANFPAVLEMLERRKISAEQAALICGCSTATFYRMKREYETKN